MNRPNIFLIMAEDICNNLGCYGDLNAITPRLDAFAKENVRFDYCYSAGPVCSAARSSLNIGMYGSTAGVGQHRSLVTLPPQIKNIGKFMQEAGYYTAIGKTDFNYPYENGYDVQMVTNAKDTAEFAQGIAKVLDENPTDKPVMIIQTSAITHQSQYGHTESMEEHRASMPRLKEYELQNRDEIVIPNYHFDTVEAREIWGQYHEKLTSFDRMFGETIDMLKEKGYYEDSVIIFVGDNGHGIPEGKCNLWDEGVHVPMIAHIPENIKSDLDIATDTYGDYSQRLVSFVDFGATFLSLANADCPDHMQGKVFLGKDTVPCPEEVFSFGERVGEVFENSRSMHEKDLMYTCDFGLTPEKRLNVYQKTSSPWFVRSMIEEGYANDISDVDRRALFRGIPRVYEQIFDLQKDPNQFDNLAEKDNDKLKSMRQKMFSYILDMRDGAFMPEPLAHELSLVHNKTVYEVFQDDSLYPIERMIKMFSKGIDGENIEYNCSEFTACEKIWFTKFSADKNINTDIIKVFVNDESETVSAYASFRLGDTARLEQICTTTNSFILLIFITDLLTVWSDQRAVESFKIITKRHCIDNDFKAESDRYEATMISAINILSLLLKEQLPEGLDSHCYWNEAKNQQTNMVHDAMDM